MRVAVVGSRKAGNLTVQDVIDQLPENTSELVSGGAIGVDRLAEQAAERLKLPIRVFLPEYSRLGKRAPLLRNEQIVHYADFVLAFWDYQSRGTAYTLDY